MQHQIMNPYLPLDEYVPDGEPKIFGGRLYIYGSHDQAGGTQFCENEYVVWSAPLTDLSDWKYEGVSYSFKASKATMEEAGNLAAPDCVQGLDGRYYLYYNRGKRLECEVAVSDHPQGPFTYLAEVTFPDGTKPKMKMFDPGVMIDDGKIYLYTGFVPTPDSPWINIAERYSQAFELEADMHTIKCGPVNLLPGCLAAQGTEYESHGFYEASSPRKINGRYYLVYSSEQSHDLCYAVSDSPMGEYHYGGILVSNADIGYKGNQIAKAPYGNTHGGLVQLDGEWYIFYHRQTHGIECCRQGCVEKVVLDEEGRFHQAEMTSCGLNHGPLSGIGTYNAAYACNLMESTPWTERLTIRQCVRDTQVHIFEEQVSEDKKIQFITNMKNGTVAGFKYFMLGEAKKISVKLKCEGAGNVHVYYDELCTKKAAIVEFKESIDWTEFSSNFSAPVGIAPLFFKLECGKPVSMLEFKLI